jgi:microcystin-dependent protein
MATKTVVSNTELSGMAANTIKANPTNSFAQPIDMAVEINQIVANFSGSLSAISIAENQVVCNPSGAGVGLTALNIGENQVFCNPSGVIGLTGLNIPANTILGNAGNGLNPITIQGINGIETHTVGNTIQIDGNYWSSLITNLSSKLDPAPIGSVIFYAASTAPVGWFECDGTVLDKRVYTDLFNVIGYTYGGSGFYFSLPDLRGEFARGWDHGRGIDSGRAFGTYQADAFGSHNHTLTDPGHDHRYSLPDNSNGSGSGDAYASIYAANNPAYGSFTDVRTTGITIASIGDTETRPRNVALLPCIKYAQTQALTQVGLNAQNILNTVNNALDIFNSGFVSNLNVSGYQKFPSGLIIQWGYAASTNNNVTLPIAYPTSHLAVYASNQSAQGSYVDNAFAHTGSSTNAADKSKIFIATKGSTPINNISNFPCYWLSLGY